MQQPVFRKRMLYAAEQEFNDAEERTYPDVKSRDWWWNDPVR